MEVGLESTKIQRNMSEQLLQEKHKQIDNVSMERDMFQLEKKNWRCAWKTLIEILSV